MLAALGTALSAELFFNIWAENFRISAAVVLYPVLLLTLMQDSRKPDTGVLTALTVLVVRCIIGVAGGEDLMFVACQEYPGALFYLCYDCLLCLQVPNRYEASLTTLWRSFWICDMLSNMEDLTLSRMALPDAPAIVTLVLLGLARSLLAAGILWGMRRYQRLLMEEDNALNQEIAATLLRMNGAEVDCVQNGREALEAFLASRPGEYDAILMDVQMPVMDGHEAARSIRAANHQLAHTIPIIATTANAFSDDISAALAAGMNAHVSKPLDMAQLCKTLSDCIRRSAP